MSEEPKPATEPVFDFYQRRILGVLMEKAFTNPEYYPMTVNSLLSGCNQKSNRNPVMDLDEDEILVTLEELRLRGVVCQVMPAPGARVNRYRHQIHEVFGWDRFERAILTELMLRGPQTVGELRTRCTRMAPFSDIQSVATFLDQLASADPPLVKSLPREPGKTAVRYMHLLSPAEETAEAESSSSENIAPQSTPAQAGATPQTASSAATPAPLESKRIEQLSEDVQGLQEEIADLHEQLAELTKRLDTLEGM